MRSDDGELGYLPVPDNGRTPMFEEGEIVYAFDAEANMYESKVMQIRKHESTTAGPVQRWEYKVHYKGWKPKWDTWMTSEGVFKFTEENKDLGGLEDTGGAAPPPGKKKRQGSSSGLPIGKIGQTKAKSKQAGRAKSAEGEPPSKRKRPQKEEARKRQTGRSLKLTQKGKDLAAGKQKNVVKRRASRKRSGGGGGQGLHRGLPQRSSLKVLLSPMLDQQLKADCEYITKQQVRGRHNNAVAHAAHAHVGRPFSR